MTASLSNLKSGSAILYSFKNSTPSAYYVLGTVLSTGYTAFKAMHILEQTTSRSYGFKYYGEKQKQGRRIGVWMISHADNPNKKHSWQNRQYSLRTADYPNHPLHQLRTDHFLILPLIFVLPLCSIMAACSSC